MKILVYDPLSLLTKHSWQVLKLCNTLVSQGAFVTVVRCKSAVNFCTIMEYKGLNPDSSLLEKSEICNKCVGHSKQLMRSAKSGIEYDAIEQTKQFHDTYNNYVVDSFYEPILKFKKINSEIYEEEKIYFRESSKTFESAYREGIRLNEKIRPDFAIVYSPQYSINSGFCKSAETLKIPVLFVEGSSSPYNRYSAIRIWNWEKNGLSSAIAKKEDYAVAKINFRSILHFYIIKKGLSHSSYSVPKNDNNLKTVYNIPPGNKVLVAVLSSSDEVFSASVINKMSTDRLSTKVFRDQFEWITQTIRHLEDLSDVSLIIRIHPREFSNNREQFVSEAYQRWEEMSKRVTANVFWDLPTEDHSLYDLLDCSDVVITGWSSVALEALYLKIPVVTYDEALSGLPRSLVHTGNSKQEYLSNIHKALKEKKNLNNRIRVLRYISFRDFDNTYNVGGVSYGAPIFVIFPKLKRLYEVLYSKSSSEMKCFLNRVMNRTKNKRDLLELLRRCL
jgi:hypothetical protein